MNDCVSHFKFNVMNKSFPLNPDCESSAFRSVLGTCFLQSSHLRKKKKKRAVRSSTLNSVGVALSILPSGLLSTTCLAVRLRDSVTWLVDNLSLKMKILLAPSRDKSTVADLNSTLLTYSLGGNLTSLGLSLPNLHCEYYQHLTAKLETSIKCLAQTRDSLCC